MKTKFTRQYAAKLALQSEDVEDGATQLAFKAGYLKAVEETGMPEIFKFVQNMHTISKLHKDGGKFDAETILKWTEELIQKATQP